MLGNCQILPFSKKNILKIRQHFSGYRSVPWSYLGEQYPKLYSVAQQLGDRFERIDITSLHDKVAGDIKHEFVRWVDTLNRNNGDNLEWWFGAVSSRNVYCSKLFQQCCYLEILKRLYKCADKKPELVVTESWGLAQVILKWATENNIAIDVICLQRPELSFVADLLLAFLRWAKFGVVIILRWLAVYFTRKPIKSTDVDRTPAILLGTIIHDDSLTNEGIFKCRYFPHLGEYLCGKQIKTLIFPFFYGIGYNFFSIYKRMQLSDTQFIIREDFLRFSDYFSALTCPLRILRQKIKSTSFRGFDLSHILRREQSVKSVFLALEPMLIYRLMLRLRKCGFQPVSVLTWYENRGIDKAFVAGARQAFPKANIKGAQTFLHPPNFLSLYPSTSESEARFIPDTLLQTSQHQCDIVRSFCKSISCQPAAALRYAHVFDSKDILDIAKKQKIQSILVLLPFDIAEAVELLNILKSVKNRIRSDVTVLIKGHPDYESKALIKAFGKKIWPKRYEIFHGNLSQALQQASLVISSASSSMVEAVVKGIPSIFMGRQTALNQNILHDLKMDIVTECFTASELYNAIIKYLDTSDEIFNKYKEMSKKVRDLYFLPVNETTIQPFLTVGLL